MSLVFYRVPSVFGLLRVDADAQFLRGISFEPDEQLPLYVSGAHPLIDLWVEQLEEYTQGMRTEFALPLCIEGTEFQKLVWQALQQISYGQTVSYGEQARRIGRPKAVRAVGTANGRNRFVIVIPCHRVVASDQALGGYAGGLENKRKLLRLEQQFVDQREHAG